MSAGHGDVTRPLEIVVGITGGIAAYKAVGVVRALTVAGHSVRVIMTDNAQRFVGPATFEAVSRNPVNTDLYAGVDEVRHVAMGKAADLIIVAPATANTIAKLAGGLADDLLGNTILASHAPLVIAPAMHTEMWQNPATVANVAVLTGRGAIVVGPAVGPLTGRDSGPGRMAEPEVIVEAALAAVRRGRDLAGYRVVVTAGGTREPLDPVRYIGNRSTGRQGMALAAAAAARGAEVILIAANIEIDLPAGVTAVEVSSGAELQDAVFREADSADVVVMAAAVADYRPDRISETKIKKAIAGDAVDVRLVRTPDILAGLSSRRRAGQVIVGFAAETAADEGALIELGRAKIRAKGCDLLVVNRVSWHEGFGDTINEVFVLDRAGNVVTHAHGSKRVVADEIFDGTLDAMLDGVLTRGAEPTHRAFPPDSADATDPPPQEGHP